MQPGCDGSNFKLASIPIPRSNMYIHARFTQGMLELLYHSISERYNWKYYHTFASEDFNGHYIRALAELMCSLLVGRQYIVESKFPRTKGIAEKVHARSLERSSLRRYFLWLLGFIRFVKLVRFVRWPWVLQPSSLESEAANKAAAVDARYRRAAAF